MKNGSFKALRTIGRRAFMGMAISAGVALPLARALARMPVTDSTPPTVTGPVTGGRHGWPFGAHLGDLTAWDYVEEEYFLEGTARSFALSGGMTPDGKWAAAPTGTASYKTRLLVRRPRDMRRFNGTVILEWLNVSFGFDAMFADAEGLYDGSVYVGVSAQKVGVSGFDKNPQGLTQWDPERYGSLVHPGDAYSYDIFSQAALALGSQGMRQGTDPLHGRLVRERIAVGVSQSGGRLLTYINAIQPLSGAFDALMPIVCAGAAAPLDDPAGGSAPARISFTRVRDDLTVPVFEMNTESEALYYFPQRQPDSPRYRYWEVAGASHGPTGQVAVINARAKRDGVSGPWDGWTKMSDVQWLPTLDAAMHHVRDWVRGGPGPSSQLPFKIEMKNGRPAYVRDQYGNVEGGVRLPEVEVPIAHYVGNVGPGGLAGSTEPFAPDPLRKLYPTHAVYVAKVSAAARAALRAGVILPYRVKEYRKAARTARIPG